MASVIAINRALLYQLAGSTNSGKTDFLNYTVVELPEMSRQDKATTDRNARTLRELVKTGDNKNCADCKKNDARWASWNLGVFLCIRCSGIHRSMGTHISKVKSIDLDIWQPEQMESITKWGNRRANLYWEAHLKAGHLPPDHKIESFIRSKYESRKWVLSDRPPRDPSMLESESQPLTSSAPTSSQAPQQSHRATGAYDPPPTPASRPTPTTASAPPRATPTGQRTAHPLLSATAGPKQVSSASLRKLPQVDLLSGDFGGFESSPAPTPAPTATFSAAPAVPGNRPPTLGAVVSPAPTPAPAQPAQTSNSSLFELDFKPPTVSSNKSSHKDIMSLFSSAPPVQAQTQGQGQGQGGFGDFGSFGGMGSFSQPQQQQQQQQQQAGRTQPPLYSPPSIATNPQAGYASWNASSGITNSTGGAGAGMNGITSGFGGMGLGADPWSTPVTQPVQQQQQSKAPAQSQGMPYSTTSSGQNHSGGGMNHYVSSQDVWGGNVAPAPASNDGFGSFGVPSQASKPVEDDPFQNIWK